jgi:hypothetical protein
LSERVSRKKLIALVRWLLPSVDDEPTEHYCVNSCQPARAKKTPCQACPRPVLYSVNREAFELFTASLTQLRVGMGGVVGLDYVAVEVVAKSLNISLSESVFSKIRIMENTYLDVISKIKDPADG